MKVLAFDQATSVGWCLMENEKIIEYGIRDFSKTVKKAEKEKLKQQQLFDDSVSLYIWAERVKEIKDFIFDKYNEYKPDLMVFETVQDNGNHDVHTKLAGLFYALADGCLDRNIRFLIMPITSWKSIVGIDLRKINEQGKSVTTKREEHKEQAIKIVREKFKIDVESDTADAICIALATQRIKGGNKT